MIYLHLGAHKTATTYLQDLLDLNRGKIWKAGVAYWPRQQIRKILRMAEGKSNWPSVRLLRGLVNRKKIEDPFSLILQTGASAILSDENILGNPNDSLTGKGYYPYADRSLGYLAKALDRNRVEIYLSVREYSAHLASLYVEALRWGSGITLDQFVATNHRVTGSWESLLKRVHDHFPNAKIVVWRYEDFKAVEGRVIERITGLKCVQLQPLSRTDGKISCSARAVEMQNANAMEQDLNHRVFSMAMYEADYPVSDENLKFQPWDKDISTQMQDQYERDLENVRKLEFVEMLAG